MKNKFLLHGVLVGASIGIFTSLPLATWAQAMPFGMSDDTNEIKLIEAEAGAYILLENASQSFDSVISELKKEYKAAKLLSDKTNPETLKRNLSKEERAISLVRSIIAKNLNVDSDTVQVPYAVTFWVGYDGGGNGLEY